jgi:dynamin 1-like protein
MGQEIPLRLGYVGVKNRAQEDIESQMPVKQAIEKEQLFFSTHPVYSSMPPGFLGVDVLTQKCTRILFTHIKHNLPEIIREIRERQRETEAELRDLGPAMPSSQGEKMHLLWNMITEFVQTYKDQISGKFRSDSKQLHSHEFARSKRIVLINHALISGKVLSQYLLNWYFCHQSSARNNCCATWLQLTPRLTL